MVEKGNNHLGERNNDHMGIETRDGPPEAYKTKMTLEEKQI
jgi:hypothetical protein